MPNFIKFGSTRASRQYGEMCTLHTFYNFFSVISWEAPHMESFKALYWDHYFLKLYISTIQHCILKSNIKTQLFADDTSLFLHHSNSNKLFAMANDCIKQLSEWFIHLYTPHSIKLPVKHTLTLPPSYLKNPLIHCYFIVSLIVFIAFIFWICTV